MLTTWWINLDMFLCYYVQNHLFDLLLLQPFGVLCCVEVYIYICVQKVDFLNFG
jgi:hypothetical protein